MSHPASSSPDGTSSRPRRISAGEEAGVPLVAGVSAVVLAVLLAVVLAVTATTTLGRPPAVDPGATVRWGLPAAQALFDLSTAVLLGTCLLMALVLSTRDAAYAAAQRLTGVAAAVWVLSAVAVPVLSFGTLSGSSLTSADTGQQLLFYVLQVPLGRYQLATAAIAVLVGTGVLLGLRSQASSMLAALGVAAAAVPQALSVDVALLAGHDTAVAGAWLLVLGSAGSAGVLLVLPVLLPVLTSARPAGPAGGAAGAVRAGELARRCSPLVLVALAVAVLAWAASGWLQVGAVPAGLATGYGALVLVQGLALAVIAVAARPLVRRPRAGAQGAGATARTSSARHWWSMLTAALATAVLVGAGTARSRIGPPSQTSDEGPRTLAEQAIEGAVPPLPATIGRLLGQVSPDLLWLVLVTGLVGAYVAGLRRLHARGDRWPVGRSVAWFAGCAVLAWVTSFGPQAYIDLLFSAHMIAHMIIMMVVPPLLVVGAPITLAMRTLPKRRDGSRGPREWVSVLVHSRWARVVTHPVVAAGVFVGSVIVFYYSPLFELALSTHLGHELMEVHFLLTGYLFASAVIGVDPGAWTTPYPLRLVLLLAVMAFHAFFGVALTQGSELLAADWFSRLGLGVDALADQQVGGAVAWGIGELPTLVMAIVLAVQWSRSDERESRRLDRAADRDGDAALASYNAMLAARAGGQQSEGSDVVASAAASRDGSIPDRTM